jgi:hypothetical protein
MSIQVVCHKCGKTYDLDDRRAGQTGVCDCGASMTVPTPEKVVESAAVVEPSFMQSTGPTPTEIPMGYGQPTSEQPLLPVTNTRPLPLSSMLCGLSIWYLFWIIRTVKDIIDIPAAPDLNFGSTNLHQTMLNNSIMAILWYIGLYVICYFLWKGRNWARITLLVLTCVTGAVALGVALSPFFRQFGIELAYFDTAVQITCIVILCLKSTREFCRK